LPRPPGGGDVAGNALPRGGRGLRRLSVDQTDKSVYHAKRMNNSRSERYHPRTLERACLEAGEQFPVLMITGPRQVGKTSLLQHIAPAERRYVSLDDMNARSLANSDPALFLQRFSPPVLIDEVQYAPPLFSAIKLLVDQDPTPGGVWLTGSQSFPLMKSIFESLAGRVAILNLLGFSAREADGRGIDVPPFLPSGAPVDARADSAAVTDLHEIYRRIWTGGFPALEAGQVHDRDLFYRSYVQTYLQRDVRDLLQVGDGGINSGIVRRLTGRQVVAAPRQGPVAVPLPRQRRQGGRPPDLPRWLPLPDRGETSGDDSPR
jgi:predicted AAA+ superfamily ATPase